MKKISFLPTKFKYNNYSKNIIMYYRDGKTTRLNKTEIPFDYYIYISPQSACLQAGSTTADKIFVSTAAAIRDYFLTLVAA